MRFGYFKYLLLLLYLFRRDVASAQENAAVPASGSGFGYEINPFAGKVFKHEAKFRLPIPDVSYGLDADFVWHTYGKKLWHQRRNYPTLGLSVTYTDYGLDKVYGRVLGVTPNVIFPLVSGKKLQWTLRLGDGIGYVTKHFRRAAPVDTTNNAIGSNVNDFAYFATDLRYHINQHWDMQLGAQFTHISDASYDKPNLGINFYGGHVGIAYYPVTSRPAHIIRKLEPLKNRILAQVRLSMAYVSSEAPGGPLYPVYLASGYLSRRWRNVNKMFAGLDYSYHSDIYAFLKNNQILPGQEAAHSWKSAFFFGNEFLVGHVGVVLQVGIYLKQADLKLDPYYEKVGGHYYIIQKETGPIKELFISAFLKTHRTIAELGEIGFGFGF